MADSRPSGDDDALRSPPHSKPPMYEIDDTPDALASQADRDAPVGENGIEPQGNGEAPSAEPTADEQPPLAASPETPKAVAPKAVVDPALLKRVDDVVKSEVGVPALLSRLKQSVVSAKEFALFLKKRSVIEDDHAQSLRKMCRATQENARKPEHRQGSFASSYDEMIFIHDRMAENGSQFAASLHLMHEDLLELVNNAERNRKMWKTNGLAAEQKLADLEQVMRKSKTKLDSLADEYDRARTGEAKQGGAKVLGAFKAHKSAAQQEEDLLRKVQTADQTYHGHIQSLQAEKAHVETSARPEAVRALQELIEETDSAVTLQMQKFAAFNEKLLLGNGLIVSPFKAQGPEVAGQPRSLRLAVGAIDNKRDLSEYLASHHAKIQRQADLNYERHPLLNPPQAQYSQPPAPSAHAPQTYGQMPGPDGPGMSFTMGSRTSTGNFGAPPAGGPVPSSQGPPGSSHGMPPGPMQDPLRSFAPSQAAGSHNRSASYNMLQQQQPPAVQQPHHQQSASMAGPPRGPAQGAPSLTSKYNASSAAAPQLGALSFQGQGGPPQSSTPPQGAPFQPPGSPARAKQQQQPQQPPPSKPVFGVALARLYERDSLAVPVVVYQCIQSVDLFGLGVEGIYRQSGSVNHINRLKGMFDADSANPALDFRNPENFYHDVNSVTGLLKQFFRDLPDPLLTMEHHDAFVNAAKHDDDIVRRDSLHAIINALPDPNYATLRAMALHLYRVMDNSHNNRMNSHNLAVIFGPTLMGSDPSTAITDAGWQIKVIDTILQNTYQIFDDD